MEKVIRYVAIDKQEFKTQEACEQHENLYTECTNAMKLLSKHCRDVGCKNCSFCCGTNWCNCILRNDSPKFWEQVIFEEYKISEKIEYVNAIKCISETCINTNCSCCPFYIRENFAPACILQFFVGHWEEHLEAKEKKNRES